MPMNSDIVIDLPNINIRIRIVSKGANPLANGYATEKSLYVYARAKECIYIVCAITETNK